MGLFSLLLVLCVIVWEVVGSNIPSAESYKVTGLDKFGAKGMILKMIS